MNWGILGCANIARRSVVPAILSVEENKLIAVSSRSQNTADQLAAEFHSIGIEGYEELLKHDEIECVYIPLPTGLHYEWVMKSLEYGKHVLVEKSAFSNLKEAEEAVGLAKSKGLAIVENFQFQHHSQHRYVRDLLAQNEIGEIRCFRSSFGFPPFDDDTNIRYKKELGGGALLDSGAYVLKATSFILGNDFEVNASFLKMHERFDVDWFGGAFLTDKTKGMFSEVAFGFDNYYQCNYEVWGSKGKIISTRSFTARPDYAPIIIVEKNGKAEEIVLEKDDHFRNMILHFNGLVKEKKFEEELNNLLIQAKLVEQVRQLAAQL